MSFVGTLPGLVFGSIDLLDSVGPYKLYAIAGDTTFGNPDPVLTTVASLLGDGSLVSIDRVDNREPVIGVEITAADSMALAVAEQALMLETRKRNTLVWTPADEFAGTTTVFEVLTSWLEHDFDDLDDARLVRRYKLHLHCYPYTRSENEVEHTSAAQPGVPSTVTIDTCDVTTGWTGTDILHPATDGGDYLYVNMTPLSAPGGKTWLYGFLRRTGASIDLTSTPYVVIDIKTPITGSGKTWDPPTLSTDTDTYDPISSAPSPIGGGWTRYWFLVTGTMSTTKFTVGRNVTANSGATGTLRITNLIRTNVPPGATRQGFITVPINGSAPADGSLSVEHATDSLGSVIIFTCPEDSIGYQPMLRGYLTSSGTTTADATLVSGARNDIDTACVFDVPNQNLKAGTYALVARLRSDTTGDIDIDVTTVTRLNSVNLDTPQTETVTANFGATARWGIVPLTVLHLPTRLLATGADGYARVTIQINNTAAANIDLDEAWLFLIDDDSALTIVHRGDAPAAPSSGGWFNRIWLDQPTVDDQLPRIWVGTQDDRSDAYHVETSIIAWDQHRFVPPTMNIFTVTSEAENAEVSLRYFPRWHTYAAE